MKIESYFQIKYNLFYETEISIESWPGLNIYPNFNKVFQILLNIWKATYFWLTKIYALIGWIIMN